jgi:hypothetical protein
VQRAEVSAGFGPIACARSVGLGLPQRDLAAQRLARRLGACPHCAEEWISIPHVQGRHHLLANEVANKPGRLSGREIRFLRTHGG